MDEDRCRRLDGVEHHLGNAHAGEDVVRDQLVDLCLGIRLDQEFACAHHVAAVRLRQEPGLDQAAQIPFQFEMDAVLGKLDIDVFLGAQEVGVSRHLEMGQLLDVGDDVDLGVLHLQDRRHGDVGKIAFQNQAVRQGQTQVRPAQALLVAEQGHVGAAADTHAHGIQRIVTPGNFCPRRGEENHRIDDAEGRQGQIVQADDVENAALEDFRLQVFGGVAGCLVGQNLENLIGHRPA